jgi:hypothetical protein
MIGATVTLAFGALGVGVTPSGAGSGTHCTFSAAPADLDPGISYTPGSGSFVDPGGGTAECTGAINGTGTYTDRGTYSDATCQNGGTGDGDPSFTIGSQHRAPPAGQALGSVRRRRVRVSRLVRERR